MKRPPLYDVAPMTVAAMREADRRAIEELGVPGIVLMENAGRGVAEVALDMLADIVEPKVLIVAGRGNNGGDGYVVARHLHNAGIRVRVFVLAPFGEIKGDAATNLTVIRNMKLEVEAISLPPEKEKLAKALELADLVLDAMLGTGVKGEIREPFSSAIRAITASDCPVLAVDIPSGLDGDTGEPLGECISADRTATLGAAKIGMLTSSARPFVGELVLVDIGMPRELLGGAK